ncbi:hypothetical protein T05_10341 [Trichinella murrelli]|uniref:Uncharacterized protein n=1 Tax=Trichinella murrelli TaxID=144512 RepID=A0A0V0UHJ0_9BILA|nr:hypothetical protein T05_10341 [Trichinella murrelli]
MPMRCKTFRLSSCIIYPKRICIWELVLIAVSYIYFCKTCIHKHATMKRVAIRPSQITQLNE